MQVPRLKDRTLHRQICNIPERRTPCGGVYGRWGPLRPARVAEAEAGCWGHAAVLAAALADLETLLSGVVPPLEAMDEGEWDQGDGGGWQVGRTQKTERKTETERGEE